MEELCNNIAHLAVFLVCHSDFPTLTDLTITAILGGVVHGDSTRSMK